MSTPYEAFLDIFRRKTKEKVPKAPVAKPVPGIQWLTKESGSILKPISMPSEPKNYTGWKILALFGSFTLAAAATVGIYVGISGPLAESNFLFLAWAICLVSFPLWWRALYRVFTKNIH